MSGPSPLLAAVTGACPRCGSRTLFGGLTRFADCCRDCALDFSRFNVGDGPAAFLILVIGAILVAAAIAVELVFQAPFAIHLVWVPVGAALAVYGLRFGKALLLALEYKHKAGEGRRR